MAELDYKSNSHKSKEKAATNSEKEKKVEKVITGTAKTKKKSGATKFADIFISEDVDNVKSYILLDVFIPAVKNIVSDVITNTIDMLFYGESGRRGRTSTASKISYNNSYRSYYDQRDSRGRDRDYGYSRTRTGYSYDEIILDNYGEADDVLDRMSEIIKEYGVVSVGDLYDLVGITGRYTDNSYGWDDIRSARIERVRGGGYLIKLPKALPIK